MPQIIAGSLRGKRLQTLEGLHTRPTTSRVKESMFNIVQFDLPGARVLDLFAGSGQLGLEALSRGAARCVFVEADRAAQKVVSANLRTCGLPAEKARLAASDAFAFLKNNQGQQFDVIFLDPPYGGELLQQALNAISLFDILAEDGIIICEHGAADQVNFDLPGLSLLKQYKYGQILITKVGKA